MFRYIGEIDKSCLYVAIAIRTIMMLRIWTSVKLLIQYPTTDFFQKLASYGFGGKLLSWLKLLSEGSLEWVLSS